MFADACVFFGPAPSMKLFRAAALGITTLLLTSCAPMPTGPSVAVMPPLNKPFEVFMQEEQLCRSWAAHSIGLAGNDAAADTMLRPPSPARP